MALRGPQDASKNTVHTKMDQHNTVTFSQQNSAVILDYKYALFHEGSLFKQRKQKGITLSTLT